MQEALLLQTSLRPIMMSDNAHRIACHQPRCLACYSEFSLIYFCCILLEKMRRSEHAAATLIC